MLKHNFIRNFLIILFLLFIYILISASSYSRAVFQDISNNVLRLHIIANSDSKEDQDLKYLVRDNIINYMNEISIDCSSKQEAINSLNNHLDEFYNIAKSTIIENGFDYDVSVSIENCNFPTKKYGDISLPSGYYDALRIKIGSATGQNWWCVMFPPLCFVDVSSGIVPDESKEILNDNLTPEDYSIITKNSNDIKLKFKLIEIFNQSK